MADERAAIDPATGTFVSGRFKGMAPEDVGAYAESLEAAVRGGGTPPEAPRGAEPQVQEKTPEQKLQEAANARVAPANMALLQRLVADDEEAFRATVTDYDKYKAKIDEVKKTLIPESLMTRGLHRQLYLHVKGQDPAVLRRVMEYKEEQPPEEQDGEQPEEEVGPPPPPPAPRAPVAPKGPKAVPPALPPSPGSRTAERREAAPKAPKLQANDKVRKFCAATGQDVREYLLRLESLGKTQADIDSLQGISTENRVQGSAYGRTLAKGRG